MSLIMIVLWMKAENWWRAWLRYTLTYPRQRLDANSDATRIQQHDRNYKHDIRLLLSHTQHLPDTLEAIREACNVSRGEQSQSTYSFSYTLIELRRHSHIPAFFPSSSSVTQAALSFPSRTLAISLIAASPISSIQADAKEEVYTASVLTAVGINTNDAIGAPLLRAWGTMPMKILARSGRWGMLKSVISMHSLWA